MDWNLPVLKFKHLIRTKEELGFDLSDIEWCPELDNPYTLGLVVRLLSPVKDFEDHFEGEAIDDAYSQLMERLAAFLPPPKAELLRLAGDAMAKAYREAPGLISGGTATKPQDGSELSSTT